MRIFLVYMDKIGGTLAIERVSPLFETPSSPGFRVFLSTKDENDVTSFVLDRHSVRERIFPGDPPYIHSEGFVDPRSGGVKRFVAKGRNHPKQLLFGLLARHLGEKANDSRHGPNLLGSSCLDLEPAIVPRVSELAKPGEHRFR